MYCPCSIRLGPGEQRIKDVEEATRKQFDELIERLKNQMPHDKNGKLLEVGDIVNIPCVVKSISTGTDYCNLTTETVEPMYPGEYKTGITLNAKQVIKAE